MKSWTTVWVAAAVLAFAAPVAGQRPDGGRAGGPGVDRPGVEHAGPRGRMHGGRMGRMDERGRPGPGGMDRLIGAALEQRDSLALTPDQVGALEALRTDLSRRNGELREQMEAARAEAGDDRETMRERMQGFMETVRTEREAFRSRFDEILTEPQRERLPELLRGRRGGPGRDGARRPPGGGRRG